MPGESTKAFLEQALQTGRQKPTQITTDKAAVYPGAIEKGLGKKVEQRTVRYL
jgi:transposase-like protein